MSDVQINIASPARVESCKFFTLLRDVILDAFRRDRLDARSLPDDLIRDIGLSPDDIAIEREINMANANLRAGIIFPRPL